MSLMKMLKRDGSKTETCETLRIALTQSLKGEPIFAICQQKSK